MYTAADKSRIQGDVGSKESISKLVEQITARVEKVRSFMTQAGLSDLILGNDGIVGGCPG